MELNELRFEIDKIDDSILKLLDKRMDLSVKVAEFKKKHKLPIHDPKRELEILDKLIKKVKKERESAIKTLYMLIFELSRTEQENV
ncbi:MAG: chorismate mutase [Oscillospiraceae bacterium]|nr:chorismate mutase [Oscillospiraceae bacterium]